LRKKKKANLISKQKIESSTRMKNLRSIGLKLF